ncbi:MAG: hypothetical protein ABW164_11615 [Sphingobium sp.]
MSLRISDALTPLLLCLALSACGSGGEGGGNAAALGSSSPSSESGDERRVACALGGGATWARDCAIDQQDDARGKALTIRHPDGGFRRFAIVTDGRGLVPADGAEQAKISGAGANGIEVAVGTDRYRLPATFAAPAE